MHIGWYAGISCLNVGTNPRVRQASNSISPYVHVSQEKLNSLWNSLINNSELVEHCYLYIIHTQAISKNNENNGFFFKSWGSSSSSISIIMVQDGQLDAWHCYHHSIIEFDRTIKNNCDTLVEH